MKNILTSASKIAFLLMAVAACAGFFLGLLESKDFMVLAGMAFSFYFSNKGETSGNVPFAGK